MLDNFEQFLDKMSSHLDVDIMPGQADFSSSFLPQQPLNSCLFPQLEPSRQSLNLVTNPHEFQLNGLHFLGTSGQNIHDIFSYTKGRMSELQTPEPLNQEGSDRYSALDAMQMTLELRHLCPTAPDTLRAYPQADTDPFVLEECPHIYFSGNQEEFGERLLMENKGKQQLYRQGVKIISVPSFQRTKSIVLMDLATLQCYEVSFGLSEGIVPVRDSAQMQVDN